MVQSYQTYWPDPVADLALRNLNRASRFAASTDGRLYSLFGAVEALFGKLSGRIGRATVGKRVAAACSLFGQDQKEAQALGLFMDQDGRALRNRIAHEGVAAATPELTESIEQIGKVLRRSLRAFIWYVCAWKKREQEIQALVGLVQPWTAQVTFNRLLALLAKGVDQVRGLLEAPPTLR
jgi:hypothetical protein